MHTDILNVGRKRKIHTYRIISDNYHTNVVEIKDTDIFGWKELEIKVIVKFLVCNFYVKSCFLKNVECSYIFLTVVIYSVCFEYLWFTTLY